MSGHWELVIDAHRVALPDWIVDDETAGQLTREDWIELFAEDPMAVLEEFSRDVTRRSIGSLIRAEYVPDAPAAVLPADEDAPVSSHDPDTDRLSPTLVQLRQWVENAERPAATREDLQRTIRVLGAWAIRQESSR